MKFAVGLPLAVFAMFAPIPGEAAPKRVDLSKRATGVATTQEAVLPENKPLELNEVVADRRFEAGEFPKESAVVGDRRSGIETKETREKEKFATPERKEFGTIERKDNPWAGKRARFSTKEDAYRSQVATRFQDKIGEASPFAGDMTPVVSKRTTFDRVNRFAFRKNGDQAVTATAAGSERAPEDISGSSSPGGAGSGLPPGMSLGRPTAEAAGTSEGAGR